MKRIKNLLNYFRLVKMLNNSTIQLAWYKVLQSVIDFATQVHSEGKPMLTKIAVIDMSKDKILGDFDMVSLWAGVGSSNPIERSRQLKEQNKFMKDLLSKCSAKLDAEKDDDLISDIYLVLKTFE